MLDRLATRAAFWTALSLTAALAGYVSVGGALPFANALGGGAGANALIELPRLTPIGLAPWLSLAALTVAVAGWRRLHRELHDPSTASNAALHTRQLHDAMQASADGVLLLRTIRDLDGTISDFEILEANPAAAALLRAERVALLGRRVRRDFPTGVSASVLESYRSVVQQQQPFHADVRVDRRQFAAGWLSHHAVPTADGLAVTLRDISTHKREEQQLRRASLTDELTRLYNRRGFLTLGEQQLRLARRQDKDAVLLYVDMDEFKALNDQYGHAEGDRALMAVARLLRRVVRDCDVVGRMGGDEFTVLALDADRIAARSIQRRIEERLALLNASGELAAPLSLTIGHTRVRPTEHAPLTEIMARADALLYARKRRRKLTAASMAATQAREAQAQSRRGESGRVAANTRLRQSLRRTPVSAPALVVPPDVAAIARATAVAAAARVPMAPNGVPYSPIRS
ncbi:MAG: GGDEF domain-containing protein [Gemmatimonadaceae bacterium]|nr:GGDEF domain-containing protein [Gemmatimonadaceae bacterium]